jgi:hypothetical protein
MGLDDLVVKSVLYNVNLLRPTTNKPANDFSRLSVIRPYRVNHSRCSYCKEGSTNALYGTFAYNFVASAVNGLRRLTVVGIDGRRLLPRVYEDLLNHGAQDLFNIY